MEVLGKNEIGVFSWDYSCWIEGRRESIAQPRIFD